MKEISHTKRFAWGQVAAGRFAETIRTDRADGCALALLGLADDTGVKLNNGRAGAAEGPEAFRRALARLGASEPAGVRWPRVFDAGDVVRGRTLEETHARVTAATTALLEMELVPVAIGGGHDLTFPFVRAVAEKFSPLAGIYFDAHLDVRETAGSGMSFRRLVEDCGVKALEVHGFRLFVNSEAHVEWFTTHGGKIADEGARVKLPAGRNLFASFDLDVIDMAFAPGVSAANPAGWTPREAEAWVRACGADRRVRCFDLMELCPRHDEGGRAARLAAHLFLTFLAGFAARK